LSLERLASKQAFDNLTLNHLETLCAAMTTDPGAVPKKAKPLIDDEEERKYDPSTSTKGG
jgi:hypothetical protein